MADDDNTQTPPPAADAFPPLESDTEGGETRSAEVQDGEEISHQQEISAIYDVDVKVSAVLGQAVMPVNQLLKLSRGAVIELNRKVGEAIDVYVNNRLVARGELVIVEDRLGITMTEIIKSGHAA